MPGHMERPERSNAGKATPEVSHTRPAGSSGHVKLSRPSR